MTNTPAPTWPSALASRPLLVADSHAGEFRDAFLAAEAEHRDMVASGRTFTLDRARYDVRDGVAIIPISGALLNRYEFIGDGSGYTSYPAITREVNRAAADPAIRAIVLTVNSPGGSAAGILTPAAAIRAARKAKPVTALVGSMAASGGYWLAAQANEIVLQDDMSEVGSIGVYTMHIDLSGALQKAGLGVSVITAGAHKAEGHSFAPLPDSVRAQIQSDIDDLRIMFARDVATGRPALSEKAALATEARMFGALNPRNGSRPAITAKLADRIASLPELIAGLAGGTPPSKGYRKVDETERSAVRAEERDRIKSIMTSTAAKGRQEQASYLAFSTAMPAVEAIGLMNASPMSTSAAPSADGQTAYERRKLDAGAGGFVDIPETKSSASASIWSKARQDVAGGAAQAPAAIWGEARRSA